MTAAELDLDDVERRAQRTADERNCWANESGIVDRDVIAGLRRAKELAVDDVPALVAEVRGVRSERDRAQLELAEEQRQRAAVGEQVSALTREVRRLQHAEMRARRHAMERDRDVAQADAFVAARDAEIARLKAVDAARAVELHDAKADVEDLRARLKATSDAYNEAENQLATMRGVARSNRRHGAVQAELLERVTAFAEEMRDHCSPHGVSATYADRLLACLAKPTEAERAPAGMEPDDVDWAVKVTRRDGTVRLSHDQDPLLARASAEQLAENARRHPQIADARPVCRDVWHGPWTPPAPQPPTSEETP